MKENVTHHDVVLAHGAENAAFDMLRTARHERDRLRLYGLDVSALEHVLRALEAKHAVIANDAKAVRERRSAA